MITKTCGGQKRLRTLWLVISLMELGPTEIIFAGILPAVQPATRDFVQIFLSFSILFWIDSKLRGWKCPRCGQSFFSGAKPTRPLRCYSCLSAAVCADSRNLRCLHSRSEPHAKTQPLTTDKFISTNPSPDTGLSEAGNPAFPQSEQRTSRGLVPGLLSELQSLSAAVHLESHDEATDKQNASQDHEHGRTRVGGAPLIETCSRHSEQPRHNAKPTRECYEYRPVMRPAIVRPDDSEARHQQQDTCEVHEGRNSCVVKMRLYQRKLRHDHRSDGGTDG